MPVSFLFSCGLDHNLWSAPCASPTLFRGRISQVLVHDQQTSEQGSQPSSGKFRREVGLCQGRRDLNLLSPRVNPARGSPRDSPFLPPHTPMSEYPIGSRLLHFTKEWRSITPDPRVLQVVTEGYVIPLNHIPPLTQIHWNDIRAPSCPSRDSISIGELGSRTGL